MTTMSNTSIHDENAVARRPFVVRARELNPRPGFDFERIAQLIERAEGPQTR